MQCYKNVIHCCLLNVVVWRRSNSGNHARFFQNTALCMQRLQINIQLNPTLYALLNTCLNSGLSITLFNTSIKLKVQVLTVVWCMICNHPHAKIIFTHVQIHWLYISKNPLCPCGLTFTLNQRILFAYMDQHLPQIIHRIGVKQYSGLADKIAIRSVGKFTGLH